MCNALLTTAKTIIELRIMPLRLSDWVSVCMCILLKHFFGVKLINKCRERIMLLLQESSITLIFNTQRVSTMQKKKIKICIIVL
jgi:hypothetical protein